MEVQLPAREVSNICKQTLKYLETEKVKGSTAQSIVLTKMLALAATVAPQTKVTVSADDYHWMRRPTHGHETQVRILGRSIQGIY